MAFLIQEVPDPKESLGCGSIIVFIIGVIVWIFIAKSESDDEGTKPVPAEIKTEQIQQTDVKKPTSSAPQTNSRHQEKTTSVPATSTKSQVKTTVSPKKGTTTVNPTKRTASEKNVTKNTSDTLTTSNKNKQTKLLSEPAKTGTSVLTDKERRKAERQAKKEAKQKEKARKK